jgi:hypothetical protein
MYGIDHVSYNVHLLVHVVLSVRHWGPLWETSAFIFEGAIRYCYLCYMEIVRHASKQVFESFLNA